MRWFANKRRDLGPWEQASPQQLQDAAIPLLALSLRCLEATHHLVVSPGSAESVRFRQQLDSWIGDLTDRTASRASIAKTTEQFADSAEALGAWQKSTIADVQREWASGMERVIGSLRDVLDGQGDMISELDRFSVNVQEIQKCNDLVKIKSALTEEFQVAQVALARQRRDLQKIRSDYQSSIQELETRVQKVEATGSIDALTEVANRASLEFYLQAICRKSQLVGGTYSIALADLDDFKLLNDKWGHTIGDQALGFFVLKLKDALHGNRFIARYGGDEFVVIAPEAAAKLRDRMERFNRLLGQGAMRLESGESVKLRASIGVAQITPGDTLERALKIADLALLEAKSAGKNRVSLFLNSQAA